MFGLFKSKKQIEAEEAERQKRFDERINAEKERRRTA